MWPLGVIAILAGVGTLVGRFLGRDNVPPMERHARALDALRHLADDPRPAVYDVASPPEMPTDHVRILAEPPPGTKQPRRSAPRRPSTGTGKRAGPARTTGGARARRGRVVPDPAIERPTIEIHPHERRRGVGATAAAASVAAVESPADAAAIGAPAPASARSDGASGRPSGNRLSPDGRPHREPGLAALRSRPYAVVVAAAVAATIGIVVVVGLNGHTTPGAAAPKTPATGSGGPPSSAPARPTTTSTTVANVVPVVSRTPDGATVKVGLPFLLTMQTTATCWVQITDLTGHALYTETLQPGASQPIPGAQAIVVKLGYAPSVTLSVDGRPLDLSGLAQTANITFQPA